MPGALSSSRRETGDVNLTGGEATSVSHEMAQDARQIRRTAHMDRPARLGTFAVSTGPTKSAGLNQKAPSLTNLRTKANFKRGRFRK
jgi:hypothetical protein